MKRILTFSLIFIVLFASVVPVSAGTAPSPKEEVVYGILHPDGSLNNLYAVNIFSGGDITDYGNYSDIRNLTSSEKLNQNGDVITINTAEDKFYYQGVLENKELPWKIAIKYSLDGKEIPGSELGGKNGALKITMSVKQNAKVNSTFFNNYALQIALSLDNKLCTNIKAKNATLAEAGSKKQITYTVLPGNGIDAEVTATVRDFEMEPITINGIKMSLGISVDSGEFTGQISELTDAIKELDDGAGDLLDGIDKLSDGMQKYIAGLKAFKNGLGQLAGGTDKLNVGATALKNGLSELTKQNDSIINGALAIQQATFGSVNKMLGEMGLGLPVLTPENYSTVLSAIPDLAAVKKQLDGAVQFTLGLKGYMGGVAQLGAGASELAAGTAELKASSSAIASSANSLYTAGVELNNAIKKLKDGLASYKKGTNDFRKETSNLTPEINSKVDEMLDKIAGNGDKVMSFVSDKNTNISAVQFALKTEPIKPPEAPKADASKPAELNFWQKLLKLFGLYK